MKRTLLVMLLGALPILAQNTATMEGTVTDASGAVLAKAQVTATNIATNSSRMAESNSEGHYSLEFLPTGQYRIDVTAPGFKKFSRTGIVLEISQTARIDISLTIGAVTEAVTVNEAAPIVNTENASLGRIVDNKEITELPLVNRDVYALLSLTAGVENSANGIVLGFPEQRTNIHGGADGGAGSVNYYLDGGSNMTGLRNTGNIAPNPDAVQEFKLVTNAYGAEFGRFSGGIVNIITKSGTNHVHGSLFEFLRNDKLNAIPWNFSTKAPLHRNQFGATLGGPVKRDKTFFFGSYGGLRQIQPQLLQNAVVPTALEREGNFSASATKPKNPFANNAAFTGNIVPSTLFDPVAKKILDQYIPLPNVGANGWQGTVANPYQSDEFLLKGEHVLNQKHTLAASYYQTNGNNGMQPANSNLVWSLQTFVWRQHNSNLGDTWLISPTTVNQFHLSYTRSFGGRVSVPQMSLRDFGSKYAIQGVPSLPQIAVSGFFTLGQAISGPTAGTNFYEVRDTLSTTRGAHTLKFGAEVHLQKYVQDTLLNNYGVFSFATTQAGNAFASFLLGLPNTMNQDTPVTAIDSDWYYGVFAQDDWRITPRLTLNLGIRYDLQTPPVDPHDRKVTWVNGAKSQVSPSALPGLLFPGDPGIGRGIVPADKNNVAPRLGLAWDPFGTGKTSIRAAAGMFYGSISGNEWNTTSNNQPFAIRQPFPAVANGATSCALLCVKSLSDPYGAMPGGSPFPYYYDAKNPRFILPSAPYGVQLDFVWPYTYQFNFAIQREVAKDLSVTAAWVGSYAHRLPFARDLNYPIYKTGATTADVNSRRPYGPGTFGQILMITSMEQSDYNGLQITVEKRLSSKLSFKGFYTFSKSLSGAQVSNNTTNGQAMDYNNMALDHGRTDFDRRHNSVTSILFHPDFFTNTPYLVRHTLNGWTVSTIATFRSGLPFNITTGSDTNVDGISNDRPVYAGDPRLDSSRSRAELANQFFNTAAFTRQATGITGNTPRNFLDGPGLKTIDLGIFRDFHLWFEGGKFQFRGELTNALNFVNLSQPNGNAGSTGSSGFGTIRSAREMRVAQLGLRLTF